MARAGRVGSHLGISHLSLPPPLFALQYFRICSCRQSFTTIFFFLLLALTFSSVCDHVGRVEIRSSCRTLPAAAVRSINLLLFTTPRRSVPNQLRRAARLLDAQSMIATFSDSWWLEVHQLARGHRPAPRSPHTIASIQPEAPF